MLPPLFGVSWGMYAVLGALAVLLIVLLALVAQRRKKASPSAHLKTKPTPKSAPSRRPSLADKPTRSGELRRAALATPVAPAATQTPYAAGPAEFAPPLPHSALPPVGYAPLPSPPAIATAPAPRVHSVPVEEILPGSDPLQAMILELLNGWGDLAQEDTNRLGVFRSDRVIAAVASTEIPKELKSNEYARARLAQLRRWASGLEYNATRREQAPHIAEPEYASITPTQATVPAFAAPVAQPVAAQPPFQQAPVYPAQAPAYTPEQTANWLQAPAPVPPAPIPEMAQQPAAAPAPQPASTAAPWNSDMADASRSTEAAIAAAAAAFWARPELGGTLPEETPSAPLVNPAPPQPTSQIPEVPPLGQELPTLTVSTPMVQAPSVVPLQPAMQQAPVVSGDPDTFLQDLGSRVSSAESLLALPPSEQPGLLAFLKPSELARVLQATGDPELKKAVIDTLESVGSPSALDIIYRCLDDPDPQIQTKALEAADRLLGAE
jgi:hypothetical protein